VIEILEHNLLSKYKELFEPDEIRLDAMKSCMAWGFACGEGWYNILDKAFSKLMLLENKPTIVQVKEKFGTLRIYMDNSSDEAYKIVSEAEKESEVTCEICGKPGTTNDHGWLSTLCNDHRLEKSR
jgi:hypothetical protein